MHPSFGRELLFERTCSLVLVDRGAHTHNLVLQEEKKKLTIRAFPITELKQATQNKIWRRPASKSAFPILGKNKLILLKSTRYPTCWISLFIFIFFNTSNN